jgi:hypothetical protein
VDSSFQTVSWNFDLKEPSERLWAVEAQGKTPRSISWNRKGKDQLAFSENGRRVAAFAPVAGDELRELMNLAMHTTLQYGLEQGKEFMLAPVSGATAMDFQQEQRSLQWIQASFGTLSRALKRLEDDPSLILTAAFFAGTPPGSSDEVIRLIAFNLDVVFYLRPDKSLTVIVFDDKNLGHGGSKQPTFQQIIKVTKPQFYDEMIKLTNQVARIGEIK